MEQFGLGWALAGIALTALVTTLGTWLVNRYTLRQEAETQAATRREELDRHGTYLAVRIAAMLDPFVMECVNFISDGGQPDKDGEMIASVSLPNLKLPEDVDWKSIDPHLMDRILTLPNEIDTALKAIDYTWLHFSRPPDHDEMFEERRYQGGRLGILALDLATDLRQRYRLKPRDYSRYDPRIYLEKAFREKDDMIQYGAEIAKQLIENHKHKA